MTYVCLPGVGVPFAGGILHYVTGEQTFCGLTLDENAAASWTKHDPWPTIWMFLCPACETKAQL